MARAWPGLCLAAGQCRCPVAARWIAVQAARVTASDKGNNGISEVRREPVDVMFLEVADTQAGITEGWQRLDELLGDLRGRHFFGTVQTQLYRVCVQQRDEDHPARLGLASGRIPSGQYLRLSIARRADRPL
jgi:hypothetical protein